MTWTQTIYGTLELVTVFVILESLQVGANSAITHWGCPKLPPKAALAVRLSCSSASPSQTALGICREAWRRALAKTQKPAR